LLKCNIHIFGTSQRIKNNPGINIIFISHNMRRALALAPVLSAMSIFYKSFLLPKLYIPSTINIKKRCSPKPFGQTKNGLVSGRLAYTSSKTEILNKIGI
jgi:hypothetical protein